MGKPFLLTKSRDLIYRISSKNTQNIKIQSLMMMRTLKMTAHQKDSMLNPILPEINPIAV